MRALLRFAAVVAILSNIALAQVTTGMPKFASFGGGPDVIDLGNLNVHWDFPIINKPGRGLPFTYKLTYDNSLWTPASDGMGGYYWQLTGGWGQQGTSVTGYVNVTSTQLKCNLGTRVEPDWYFYDRYTFISYVDSSGTVHPFSPRPMVYDDNTCDSSFPYQATATTQDGSGISGTVFADPSASLQMGSGVTINAPVPGFNDYGSLVDSNGNVISTADGANFTDTLGVPATLSIAGTAQTGVTYTYKTIGSTNSVTVTYTAYTLLPNFGCTIGGIAVSDLPYQNSYLPTAISRSDGGNTYTYSIQYEDSPGNPGNKTGRISSITLPTGGTISYAL